MTEFICKSVAKAMSFERKKKKRDEERRKSMLEDRLIVCEEKVKKARKAPQL